MGLDPDRFPNTVDEELVCPICSWVLHEPVQTSSCEHAFCKHCIEEWLKQRPICPIDRQPISVASLSPVPRILRNLLSRQLIYCENRPHGCTALTRLDGIDQHLRDCEFGPSKLIECRKGCGATVAKDQEHNCLLELRCLLNSHENRLDECQRTISDQSIIISSQELRIKELEERLKILLNVVKLLINDNNIIQFPLLSSLTDEIGSQVSSSEGDSQELQIWACSLPVATVTRWGGMISTPDPGLQVVLRRALVECGCPSIYVDHFMLRAHERCWPPGLESLDVRQLNRRQYDNYVCRRIPGKQAVIILSLDNQHMPDDMICCPGIIMIFAHGNLVKTSLQKVHRPIFVDYLFAKRK